MDKVHHFGGFKEGLEVVLKKLQAEKSSSLILRGNVGCGKKTLIREAESMCDVISIHLNPHHYPDEYTGLRHIAIKLGLEISSSIQEIMGAIEVSTKRTKKRILVVLEDFEGFCRTRQTLLYCLTSLVQHGYKFTLIGLTCSLYWSENLEKRVRSRLLADFYELTPPYRTGKEYVQFASLLLGGYQIRGILKDQLEYIYKISTNGSIRELKTYLNFNFEQDKNGIWTIKEPLLQLDDPNNDMQAMAERLGWLTKTQMDLLKIAVCFCSERGTRDFNLKSLVFYATKHKHNTFEVTSTVATRNTALLVKCGLFRQSKQSQRIDTLTTLTLGITPKELKIILVQNEDFHCIKTDSLWKKL